MLRSRKQQRDLSSEASTKTSVISGPTLVDYVTERFTALCVAADFGDETANAVETLRRIVAPWGHQPIGRAVAPEEGNARSAVMRVNPPSWRSDIADDNTPVEFSVAIHRGRTEVRALFEAQGDEPTLESYRTAGIALIERLERENNADLTRFRQLQDLFLPESMCGPFTVWASAVFSPGRPPAFKAYFNPQARGPGRAGELVDEGLRRLGLSRSWAALCRTVARRGPHLDELKYFALDLTSEPQARIKVYVRHHEATPSDLEAACSGAQEYVPGEGLHFALAMAGGNVRLSQRATFTCSAFIEGHGARPISTTLYVPICAYAAHDADVKARVNTYLPANSFEARAYNAIVDGYTNRPLDEGVGMQSWVAFRRFQGETRLTVYLGTEANRVFPPRTVPASTAEHTKYTSAEDVVRCVARYDLAQHPFVQRLHREPKNGGPLWLMIANVYEGTSKHFVRWLATLTARVEDDRVRCLLARQLDQELGEGDFTRSHAHLIGKFLTAVEPLRPADFDPEQLASGRRLGSRLAELHLAADPIEGVGALMAAQLCAQQLIGACRELVLAQRQFDRELLGWLWLHDEADAEGAFKLARTVPAEADAVAAVARGAMGLHTALWECLDELYTLCFAGSLRPPSA